MFEATPVTPDLRSRTNATDHVAARVDAAVNFDRHDSRRRAVRFLRDLVIQRVVKNRVWSRIRCTASRCEQRTNKSPTAAGRITTVNIRRPRVLVAHIVSRTDTRQSGERHVSFTKLDGECVHCDGWAVANAIGYSCVVVVTVLMPGYDPRYGLAPVLEKR